MKTYRNTGAVGAILDEYERALEDYKSIIASLTLADYQKIRDYETKDPDCKSIESITKHVINSGFGYICYIEKMLKKDLDRPVREAKNPKEALAQIDEMFAFNELHFGPKSSLSSDDPIWAIREAVPWGVVYDIEQLMEHAIVHILRHRRQIERMLILK